MFNYAQTADDLESCRIPVATESVAASPSGVIGAALAVITAVRSGDVKAIAVAVRNLLNVLIGDDGEINFGAAGVGFDWKRLMDIIMSTLLPLIFKQ